MRYKATFLIYGLVGVILACLIVSVRAANQNSNPCDSYLTDYLEKTKVYEDARDTLVRAKVATAKASPSGNVPPEYKEYEDEYDSNTNDFFNKLKDGMSTHPKVPSNTLGILTGLSQASQQYQLMQVEAAALEAANNAFTAQQEAEKALSNCQGQSIVTIWCERGADCQMAQRGSSNTNPKAHQTLNCPDKIKGLLGIKVNCPEKLWSCDPTYICPRSSDHVSDVVCRGPCGKPVLEVAGVPFDGDHQTICTETAWRSETVRINDETYIRKYVPSGSDARCPQGVYYHCNIGLPCPNAANHVGSDETVTEKYIDSNGNEVPNPATPLACGHTVGSAGIHLRVSCEFCSEQFYFCAEGLGHGMARCPRNESGETCTVSGGRMILCADPPHVHQYPSAPKQTQADAAPTSESNTDKNDGKTPKQTGASKEMVLAACGVHTIEKGSSSAHSHREVSCRLDGYGNACDPGSYYVCQEDEHRHQYPNTPKGFRKVIVCPAHAWTGCKGTKSHAETCPAGHSYYTCNKAATAAHEAHTASDASPKSPSKNTPNNDGHSGSNPNNNNGNSNNKGGDSSEGVRKCGHPKSMGGDHSFVASCTETNANGDTCQRTSGYWPCRGQHTHKFPEPEARRKCGHLKSASGDHSFIASCPATNANGDTCQRTSGYWPCKGQHTHLFPESSSSSSSSSSSASSSANNNNDDDSDDASDDDSDDADENLVKCGRPKCGSMVSSASAHKSTCGRGHSYWSCKTEAVAAHLNH
ncbi:MAG: hypothetical protein OXN25_11245 [Candidatus Poribacteria bacterium]|nr:hypothetical protein [Candidatus Poribacteria bacterium]